MKLIHNLKNKYFLRSLIPSIFFNLKYLPFKQAVKLPILLYKPKFRCLKGSVEIDSEKIYSGMIKLGFMNTQTYPNTGITWSNKGKVKFRGKCLISNDSHVVVGRQGQLTFGNDFLSNAGLKLMCQCRVYFGDHTRIGWGVCFVDTNFHPLYDMEKKKFKKAFGPIEIGEYNWFATQCYVMHSVKTPERCIFGARSVVTRGGQFESYCVHGGSPLHVLSRNVMRDYDNDLIKDYSIEE